MASTYNVMVGSDSSVFFSLEDGTDKGLILGKTEDAKGFVKNEYPILERRTGHSIKGSTESIESSEIRKGRTKSAPRKGNSSSEGSLDIELSPQSYDDIFEAALRGEWKEFTSDYGDKVILKNPGTATFAAKDGKFLMKGSTGAYIAKRLVAASADSNAGSGATGDAKALIVSDVCDYEISQLQVGTKAKLFDAIVEYGGPDGALYQDFEHLAVNTMSLTVSPGQIVTGSFGFMGTNDPNLQSIGLKQVAGGTAVTGTVYYEKSDDGEFTVKTVSSGDVVTDLYVALKQVVNGTTASAGVTYYEKNTNGKFAVKAVSTGEVVTGLYVAGEDEFADTISGRFNAGAKPSNITTWITNLKDITESTFDQFTAREGFLIVNGTEVDYGSNLTFELNNGLKKLFAIFRPDAVANPAMSLDITGTLDAYLIKGHTETLFNYSTNDTDVELLFTFQDKDDKPENLYVFQIFKTKFDKDFGGGSDELSVSLPYTSFEERAVRVFRLKKRTVMEITAIKSSGLTVTLAPLTVPTGFDYTNYTKLTDAEYAKGNFDVKVYDSNGNDVTATYKGTISYSSSTGIVTMTEASTFANKLCFEVTFNGVTYKKWYEF